MKSSTLYPSLIIGMCVAFSGCESPAVHIPAQFGTWTGNAYEVVLPGDKHHAVRETPKSGRPDQMRFFKVDNGHSEFWTYLTKALTLEWGRLLIAKPPMPHAEYEPGQIGDLEGMVILIDSRGYPIDPSPYRGHSLRVSGRLMAGRPKCPMDDGQLSVNYSRDLPFSVMLWCLETSRDQIQDLGPLPPGTQPYFPRSVMFPTDAAP